jgi:hypothetical protein
VREELIEKILDKMSRSIKREYDIEKYVHDYAYGLKLGEVKLGDEKLVKRGIEYVNMKMSENKKK